jgi:hypothetical protein
LRRSWHRARQPFFARNFHRDATGRPSKRLCAPRARILVPQVLDSLAALALRLPFSEQESLPVFTRSGSNCDCRRQSRSRSYRMVAERPIPLKYSMFGRGSAACSRRSRVSGTDWRLSMKRLRARFRLMRLSVPVPVPQTSIASPFVVDFVRWLRAGTHRVRRSDPVGASDPA